MVFVDGNGVSIGGWEGNLEMEDSDVGQQHKLPYATKVCLKIVTMVNFVTSVLLKF